MHSSSMTKSPLPDPRSRWQPQGVHGPSRMVDHKAFEWTDAHFTAPPLSSAIIYELHIGTFTPLGTFEAAIARLDHLVDLGVTHVELMPVAEFSGDRRMGLRLAWTCSRLITRMAALRGSSDWLTPVTPGARGPARRRLQPFRPVGKLFASLRPLSHRPLPHAMGQRRQLRWPGQRRGTPAGVRQRFVMDGRLPYRRPAAGRDPRDSRRLAIDDTEQLATETASLARQTGRSLVLIAENDLNDPRVVTVPVARGIWHRRAVERRFPSRTAHRADRGEKSVTIPISVCSVSSPRRYGRPTSMTVNTRHTGIAIMGDARSPDCRATTS